MSGGFEQDWGSVQPDPEAVDAQGWPLDPNYFTDDGIPPLTKDAFERVQGVALEYWEARTGNPDTRFVEDSILGEPVEVPRDDVRIRDPKLHDPLEFLNERDAMGYPADRELRTNDYPEQGEL